MNKVNLIIITVLAFLVLGVNVKADPIILNSTFATFEAGGAGIINVTIKNDANADSTFSVGTQCSGGFGDFTYVGYDFGPYETKDVQVKISASCQNATTTGSCLIVVTDAAMGGATATSNVSVECSEIRVCIEGKTKCSDDSRFVLVCKNNDYIIDKECHSTASCQINATTGLPECVTPGGEKENGSNIISGWLTVVILILIIFFIVKANWSAILKR